MAAMKMGIRKTGNKEGNVLNKKRDSRERCQGREMSIERLSSETALVAASDWSRAAVTEFFQEKAINHFPTTLAYCSDHGP